ncbi:MAG: LacI family DNA-binding transcriptional regulator [Verrucomicrobiae bacterium]|nr:LacI family DNA-binding transcriptional regulator [Verrucomicrobiae bacterium]
MGIQKKIAILSGVSQTTVSFVLSGKGTFPESTRTKILQAAKALKYKRRHSPEKTKKAARKKGRPTLGLFWQNTLFEPFKDSFFQKIFEGIMFSCIANQLDISIKSIESDSNVDRQLKSFDAAIIMHTNGTYNLACQSRGTPLVTVFGDPRDGSNTMASVNINNQAATRIAFEHLYAMGHRRIGYMSPSLTGHSVMDRWEGMEECFLRYGLVPDPAWTTHHHYNGYFLSGKINLNRIWQAEVKPTAIVAYNDMTALGMLEEARSLGIRVPEDLSIVSLDNIYESETSSPPLTTVDFDLKEIGARAVVLAHDLFRNPRTTPHVVLEPRLIPRQSVCRIHQHDLQYA